MLINMKEVIVAVDGSDYSEKVYKYALERAKNLDYNLTFLQVVPGHTYGGEMEEKGLKGEIESAEKFTEELKNRAIEEGVNAKNEVITGVDISIEIVKYADEGEYDLIIVGGKGKSDLGTIHLGSVAEGVVKRAPCSVLVVH